MSVFNLRRSDFGHNTDRGLDRYDRIMVIDAGNLAAFDSPLALYDAGGIFRTLCDRSNTKREQILLARGGMQSQ